MQVTRTEFQTMVEGITADLIVMLIQQHGYTTEQAVKAVFCSHVNDHNPQTSLYYQSLWYVGQYYLKELGR